MDELRAAIKYMNLHIDKVVHFLGGYLIGSLIAILTGRFEIAIGFTILVGGLKEIYDFRSREGTPEVLDFVFTCLGGCGGAGAVFMLMQFVCS